MKITSDMPAEEVRQLIGSEYKTHGYKLGWNYLLGPLSTRETPEIVTIGLNPGGGRSNADWGSDANIATFDPEIENAYFDQPWRNNKKFTPLQGQIQYAIKTYYPKVKKTDILSFNLIPFRSPKWAEFPSDKRSSAIEFGVDLMRWAVGEMGRPRLILGFGLFPVADQICSVLEATEVERVCVGWGKVRARLYETERAERMVIVPHLSTYRIFGRSQFFAEAKVMKN